MRRPGFVHKAAGVGVGGVLRAGIAVHRSIYGPQHLVTFVSDVFVLSRHEQPILCPPRKSLRPRKSVVKNPEKINCAGYFLHEGWGDNFLFSSFAGNIM